MARPGQTSKKDEPVNVGPHDILFECPACGKSLVVDDAAEGLSVNCVGCATPVIVPPKPQMLGATQVMQPFIPPTAQHKPIPATPPKTEAPKPVTPVTPPPKIAAEPPKPAPTAKTEPQLDVAGLHERLASISNQLKEIQTQWTELTNRIASNINEVNRDLLQMAKLETSQKQMLSDWNQIVGQIAAAGQKVSDKIPTPAAVGASAGGGRSKVAFGG